MAACPNCGSENAEGANFCSVCGEHLGAAEAPAEVRKTVTIVFTDLRAANRAGEPLSPERQRDVMARAFEVAHRVLSAHGGTVEKFAGDAVMAAFGIPVSHEDDALRAARAALDIRVGMAALNERLVRELLPVVRDGFAGAT